MAAACALVPDEAVEAFAFAPSTPIPIYVAAIGPDMLRLAGRIGDGVVLSAGLSTDSVRQSLALCAQGAAKAGRDAQALRRAGYLFFGVSRDAKEAIDAVRQKLAFVMRNKFLASARNRGLPVPTAIAAHPGASSSSVAMAMAVGTG
jgi:alkanesulfonate monooxygenase SsuD/methylene tetrahydromethanopterin reductase-like flavin-dependent oxidoreductase (luciferase family)